MKATRARVSVQPAASGPPPSGIVTLLTDFGLDDPYVGVVKGVVLGLNPAARLVDLTHAVPPQDILRGALALEGAYRFFPRGTVHLAVVDPGVGGSRRPLAVLADGHYFVGPDNGLLGFLFGKAPAAAVAVTNQRYHRAPVSRTFHARDIFAPVAAHCSLGVPLHRFGPAVHDAARLDWPRPRRVGNHVEGQVLLADRFDNLLTNVAAADLPGPAPECVLELGRTRIEGLVRTYADRPPGELGALLDSSGRVEVFVREGSARERLGLGTGAAVRLWASSAKSSSAKSSPSRKSSGSWRSRSGPRPSSPTPSPSFGTRRGSR